MGMATSKTSIFNSKRAAIGTGKSGWEMTPPGMSLLGLMPRKITATLSPALATPNAFESCSIDQTVAG
jgi:hypothetical protein